MPVPTQTHLLREEPPLPKAPQVPTMPTNARQDGYVVVGPEEDQREGMRAQKDKAGGHSITRAHPWSPRPQAQGGVPQTEGTYPQPTPRNRREMANGQTRREGDGWRLGERQEDLQLQS